jgi:hypothetical protein
MPEPKCIGVLSAQQAKGKKAFSFEYDVNWIRSKEQQLLDPDITWFTGPQYPNGKENFGVFMDSMPDTWGRTLMKRRAALLSKEAREWISSESSFRVEELDPELALLHELLPPLQGVENLSPSIVLALIPTSLQPLVSGWELEKLPSSPLLAIQDAIRNLRMIDLKKKQQTATLLLRKPSLETAQMISVQKEILDLQLKINDLSAPRATSVPTVLR